LFPQLTVRDTLRVACIQELNCGIFSVLFQTKMLRVEEARIAADVDKLLALFEFTDIQDQLAVSLPYGQQRRLEIVRALATKPKLLLLDEPFEGVAPALSARLSEVIGGLRGGDLSVLIAQSDLNHSKNLLDAEIVIERGANRQPT
jgi:ABC-type branched-subunit amino acid transport system ATPase component